ncbi:hypothetical protein [Halorubrum vacuolatum]|uniref:Uncharacterized protein n=1 Tax=Halorubrum vacuolatum TaxID=63740 RepID=A0A238X206_HALVU|nr:hypothetical protein [Halorubrum vacuolatum]SNR52661.1 hypothetical protein SAMN06264855_11254 [Halorubrum vacuolatum]
MGIGEILSGEEMTMRQVGIIIVGWILLVSVVSVLLLLYTRFFI